MVPYLNSVNQPNETFHQAKVLLNQEFYEEGRITNLVGILYYPTQFHYLPLPHTKLELEGKCYILCGNRKDRQSLERKIISALRGNLPFARIGISVTPKQLKELKKNVKSIDSATCSQGVSDALGKYADFKIPFPFSFGPTLSAAYLLLAKKTGYSRITSYDCYIHYKNNMDKIIKIAYPMFGLAIEGGFLGGPVLVYVCTYTIINSLKFD